MNENMVKERRDKGEPDRFSGEVELSREWRWEEQIGWPDTRQKSIESLSEHDIKQTSELKFDIKGRVKETGMGQATESEGVVERKLEDIIEEQCDRQRKIGWKGELSFRIAHHNP